MRSLVRAHRINNINQLRVRTKAPIILGDARRGVLLPFGQSTFFHLADQTGVGEYRPRGKGEEEEYKEVRGGCEC